MVSAPRDIYEHDVDFTQLAKQDPAFAKKLKPNKQLDFSDPDSVLQLTKSLLRRDFDLDIELPNDRLCPPVPNRFNYILWLQDLLDSTSPDLRDSYDPNRKVLGIDIGTGASAIYPLLAARQRPNWNLLATEADPRSLEYAQRNISLNRLEDRIKLVKVEDKDEFLVPKEALDRLDRIDFLMTNPPFYTSSHDLLVSAKRKARLPNSVCTGAPTEMITPGGEVGFISRLISQSSQPELKGKVQWWSSMLGKLENVAIVVERLKREGCVNWAVAEFVQGQRTRRWVVAWSLEALRPSVRVGRGVKSKALKGATTAIGTGPGLALSKQQHEHQHVVDELEGGLLPFPSEFEFEVHTQSQGTGLDVAGAGRCIDLEVSKLDLQWQWKAALGVGLAVAQEGDCWSRKARRKKEQQMKGRGKKGEDEEMRDRSDHDDDEEHDDEEEEEKEPELVVKIRVRPAVQREANETDGKRPGNARSGVTMVIRWLQGRDHVLFESFCGWLKRKVAS